MTLTAKVPIPVDDKPDFNWVGRIIGPGGVTLKSLENKSGCKVSLRGKGSVRESEVIHANDGTFIWGTPPNALTI